jgi:cell division protein FtsI (penicillin-binding protein 3)
MSIKKSILLRIQTANLVITGIAVVIVLQIINVQFLQGEYWQQRADEMGLQYRTKKATRGTIYAENGIMLAASIPLYKVSFDPMIMTEEMYRKNIDTLCKILTNFFPDKKYKDYLAKINEARKAKKRYLVLSSRPITFTEKQRLSSYPIFKERQNKGGILFEKVEERTYPFGSLAARTIGFVNENKEGAGLEMSFEKLLSGTDGKALYQKITGGEWKPVGTGTRINPINGNDIYTTIDINLQDVAQEELSEYMSKYSAKYGCVVVMEVQTGAIKAMVNLGKEKNEYRENYNYAIGDQGSIDPGSTFKTASMLALLEDSTALKLEDTLDTGNGLFRYYDREMKDTRIGGWGKQTIQQVLENSSNIGVSKLITRHFGKKIDKYLEYLNKFGLNKDLEKNLKLSGIAKPYIKTPKDATWSGVTLPWMSIGYELRLSPLQMLTFYNAIANNGYLASPYLVKMVKRNDEILEEYKPIIEKNPIAKNASIQKIKTMLEGVVERGTATTIKSKKFKIAGKTGTSQKLNARGRYIKKYHTSFVGYFPAEKPKYSCIVVIDEPEGSEQYGGDVSAPVFKAIAEKLYAQDIDVKTENVAKRDISLFYNDLPTQQVTFAADAKNIFDFLKIPTMPDKNKEWVKINPGKYQIDWEEQNIKSNAIPNVKGMSLRDAIYVLENIGLKVFYTGKGRVKTQSLMPGSPFRKGEKIIIQLEGGWKPPTYKKPLRKKKDTTNREQKEIIIDTTKTQRPVRNQNIRPKNNNQNKTRLPNNRIKNSLNEFREE